MSRARKNLSPRLGLRFPNPQWRHLYHPSHPSSPRSEFTCPALLPGSAFLGKEKSSLGGKQAGGQAAMLIHQLPAALVTVVWGPGSPAGSASPANGCRQPSPPAKAIQGLAAAWSCADTGQPQGRHLPHP